MQDKPLDHAHTDRLIADWNERLPIARSLPVKLPGKNEVESFSGCCAKCHEEIPGKDMHGTAVRVIATVLTISAVGYCRSCRHLTEFNQRIRAVDGGVQMEWIGADGKWRRHMARTASPRPLAVIRRFARQIKRLVWS